MLRKYTFFLSILSGLLLSLPWLAKDTGWVLLFAFIPLLYAEELTLRHNNEIRNFQLFTLPFFAFLLWNLLSIWCIAYVSFFGMLLIIGLNTFLMTVAWWLKYLFRRQFSSTFFILLVFWLSYEFFQYNWAIQMPWLNLGNGFANSVKIIQWYEFTGVLGGSLWILLANFLLFSFVKSLPEKSFRISIKWIILSGVTIFLPILWSLYIYINQAESGPTVKILIIQPNIDPYTEKFSVLSNEDQVSRLISLAESNLTDSTDILLAPETALPELWEDSINLRNKLLVPFAGIFNKYPNISLIAGAMTKYEFTKPEHISATARKTADGSSYYDIFNSALFMNSNSKVQISHKNILVSGVEKMPFQNYFSLIKKYSIDIGGTSGSLGSGNEPVVFDGNKSIKIGPVICYESAFGEHCGKLANLGANFLVVITNDGWWKDSPGSWQHFSYSRLRAIETRRSIARSANTGISGFINKRGDILIETSLNSETAISSEIRLNYRTTFYSRNGDWIGRICVLLSVLIGVYYLIIRWKRKVND